ncbi:MAG: TIGR04283 family arsenosugar biosynthesis glycosyltransferase [Gammaproteobacteria bacterium]|jgi:rSAM/selenodomain-associated transferase 2
MTNRREEAVCASPGGDPRPGEAADAPTISVVVPVLNETGTLAPSLQCLQALRGRGHEVIVVDGGSSDDSMQEAAPLADRVLQVASGRARQMHAGALAAGGNVLWFLHADTLAPADADHQIQDALADGQGSWGWFDVRLAESRGLLACVAWLMNRRARLTGIATGDQGIFVQRTAYEQAGGFPRIPLMEDIALCRRLKRLARPVRIAAPLHGSARRWEKHGVVRTILTMWSLRLGYFLGVNPRYLARFYAVHRP